MSTSLTGFSGGYGPTGRASGQVPSGYQYSQLQSFSPEQMDLFKQLFSHVSPSSHLGKLAGGDQSYFNQLEAPALRQFQGLQGQLASRFSGMGTGTRRSSGFNIASGQQLSDFAQDLQAQRLGLQRQAIRDLGDISSSLLGQKPYEQFLLPEKNSFLQELVLALAGGGGRAIGNKLLGGF